jgi:NADH-quinone oxidoreductase subunit K
MNAPIQYYTMLALLVFCIGALGVLTRKNAIVLLMCIELMLNAVNVLFVTFSSQLENLNGHIAVFFIMIVAAAEAAVGLGIVISIYRAKRTVDTCELNQLQG